MPKPNPHIFDHAELKVVLLLIGYALLSWPVFAEQTQDIGVFYISLFLLWLVAIAVLFVNSKSR